MQTLFTKCGSINFLIKIQLYLYTALLMTFSSPSPSFAGATDIIHWSRTRTKQNKLVFLCKEYYMYELCFIYFSYSENILPLLREF